MSQFTVDIQIIADDAKTENSFDSAVMVELAEDVDDTRLEVLTKWCAGQLGRFMQGQFPTAEVTVHTTSYGDNNRPELRSAMHTTLAAWRAANGHPTGNIAP